MTSKFTGLTVAQICKAIDTLTPCMDDFVYVYDLVNDFYYISKLAVERFCLPSNQFHNVIENHAKFVYPADIPMLQQDLEDLVAGRKVFHDLLYRWVSVNNDPIWINCRGFVVRHENTPLYMLGCINEIGARQKADNVSGLLGVTSLQAYFSTGHEKLPNGYLLRLGIDDFKEINEKLGIDYGDLILKRTAECITACLLPDQKLFRAVADEYLIINFSERSTADAIEQYKHIRQTIDTFIKENNYEAIYTISGGILKNGQVNGCSFSDAMKFSEFSLNEAKRHGKNCCYIFCREDYEKFLRKRTLSQLLRRAVTHNFKGFEAYLQPLVNTDTNTVYGAESLMRFHTDKLGTVSPSEFIPLLEETGLIIPVGKWMLNEAMKFCHEIQKTIPDFKISINISYVQVIKSNIITEILNAVKYYHIPPSTIIIELTESGLVDLDSRVIKLWSRLKENGICLALDDFGTGYSNFHYLNELKPDIIKIDRTFTIKAVSNDYEFKLLSLMSNMVHSMDLRICVEGVENTNELSRMKELLPDYYQGYYFGKPCPFNEFQEKFVS